VLHRATACAGGHSRAQSVAKGERAVSHRKRNRQSPPRLSTNRCGVGASIIVEVSGNSFSP
jgi:hypothetical protein